MGGFQCHHHTVCHYVVYAQGAMDKVIHMLLITKGGALGSLKDKADLAR